LDIGIWGNDGIVAIGPLRFEGPHADVSGDMTLDLRAEPKVGINLKAKLEDASLWVGDPARTSVDISRADAAVELYGSGNSFAEILSSAYGQTNLLVGPGNAGTAIRAALPDFIVTGLDKQSPESNEPLAFNCVISRFDVSGGRAVSRAFMVEAAEAVTTGQGELDLAREKIDFKLAPRPKDPFQIQAAQDIKVSGQLLRPTYQPLSGDASRGLSHLAGQAALEEGADVLMPLLGSATAIGNTCVRSLLGMTAPVTADNAPPPPATP
jgi:hypothetical protein